MQIRKTKDIYTPWEKRDFLGVGCGSWDFLLKTWEVARFSQSWELSQIWISSLVLARRPTSQFDITGYELDKFDWHATYTCSLERTHYFLICSRRSSFKSGSGFRGSLNVVSSTTSVLPPFGVRTVIAQFESLSIYEASSRSITSHPSFVCDVSSIPRRPFVVAVRSNYIWRLRSHLSVRESLGADWF